MTIIMFEIVAIHMTLLQVDIIQPEEECIRMILIRHHPHAGHHMVESTGSSRELSSGGGQHGPGDGVLLHSQPVVGYHSVVSGPATVLPGAVRAGRVSVVGNWKITNS